MVLYTCIIHTQVVFFYLFINTPCSVSSCWGVIQERDEREINAVTYKEGSKCKDICLIAYVEILVFEKVEKEVIAVSISFPKLQKTVLERNKPSLGQKPKFQQADRTQATAIIKKRAIFNYFLFLLLFVLVFSSQVLQNLSSWFYSDEQNRCSQRFDWHCHGKDQTENRFETKNLHCGRRGSGKDCPSN